MTDHEGLFQEMREVAERDDHWVKAHGERYLVGYESEGRSRYQRIWEGHGIPTLRFELVKGGPGERD
jgi:tRNA (guanine-N7-)-methyltransferase